MYTSPHGTPYRVYSHHDVPGTPLFGGRDGVFTVLALPLGTVPGRRGASSRVLGQYIDGRNGGGAEKANDRTERKTNGQEKL